MLYSTRYPYMHYSILYIIEYYWILLYIPLYIIFHYDTILFYITHFIFVDIYIYTYTLYQLLFADYITQPLKDSQKGGCCHSQVVKSSPTKVSFTTTKWETVLA